MARYRIRSNCIAPFAWSRMIGSIPTDTPEQQARVEKLKRMTPEKIAPMAVFLASDAAFEVTGQVLGVRNHETFPCNQTRSLRALQRGNGWPHDLIAEHSRADRRGKSTGTLSVW